MTIPKINVDEEDVAIGKGRTMPTSPGDAQTHWESKIAKAILALIAVFSFVGLFGRPEVAHTALICLTISVGFLAVLSRLD